MDDRVADTLEPLLRPRRVERMKSVLATRSDHVAFVFEQMVDPHNLSAALRSLDAFSFQDAYLVNPQARIGLSKGITQGSEKWLTLTVSDDLIECVERLSGRGYRVLASHLEAPGSQPLAEIDFSRPVALLFGNEHAGVSEMGLALAEGVFHIPMHGFVESLNLAVATALCAHHARREMARLAAEGGGGERFLLAPERRAAIYGDWLRRSVRRADQILAEARQREGC